MPEKQTLEELEKEVAELERRAADAERESNSLATSAYYAGRELAARKRREAAKNDNKPPA